VQELPELVTMNRMYRGRPFELITISLDEASAKDQALEVLKTAHVSAKNYLFDSTDRDKLAEALDPQWKGPVPYTLLIAPGGQVIYRHDGPIDPLEVKRAIVGVERSEPPDAGGHCGLTSFDRSHPSSLRPLFTSRPGCVRPAGPAR
jgi:hypothetical protein